MKVVQPPTLIVQLLHTQTIRTLEAPPKPDTPLPHPSRVPQGKPTREGGETSKAARAGGGGEREGEPQSRTRGETQRGPTTIPPGSNPKP